VPSQPNPVLVLIVILATIPVVFGLYRRREGICYRVKNVIVNEVIYLGIALIIIGAGRPPLESVFTGLATAFLVALYRPRPSRHFPASVRRSVKAQHELKTGEKFNPKKHELDHTAPYSRLGGNTFDNLSVVEKKRNCSKGSRSAWCDVLGR
jgi:hypothetical protein